MKFWCLGVAACLLIVGCAKKQNDIVGTWHSDRAIASTTWHFFPDGKLKTEFRYDAVIGQGEGTYAFEDNLLVIKTNTVNVQGPEPMLSQVKAKIVDEGRLPIVWRSPFNF
jgi:hypothetical protein